MRRFFEKILKLYDYLKDGNKTKEIGSKILKAMIIDMIRSKLGVDPSTHRNWVKLIVDPVWLDSGWSNDIPSRPPHGPDPFQSPRIQRTLSARICGDNNNYTRR
jgi:hypothetical protein